MRGRSSRQQRGLPAPAPASRTKLPSFKTPRLSRTSVRVPFQDYQEQANIHNCLDDAGRQILQAGTIRSSSVAVISTSGYLLEESR